MNKFRKTINFLESLLQESFVVEQVNSESLVASFLGSKLIFQFDCDYVSDSDSTRVNIYEDKNIDVNNMIAQKHGFVIPGRAVFFPSHSLYFDYCGLMAFDEHLPFTPVQQAVFLVLFYYGIGTVLSVKDLQERTGYSYREIEEAFGHFESIALGYTYGSGQYRQFEFASDNREDIFLSVNERLVSPVVRRFIIEKVAYDGLVIAGNSAIPHYSMLDGLPWNTYAVAPEQMPIFQEMRHYPCQSPDLMEIEVWSYDPRILAKNSLADPISLAFSLKYDTDTRVVGAVEKMLQRCLTFDTEGYSQSSYYDELPDGDYHVRGFSDAS